MKPWQAVMACAALAGPLSAAAAGAPDEASLFQEVPLVTGASRYEQRSDEAPSSISIVTAEDIRRHGYRTLDEIVDSVRGFTVSNDRNYSTLGVRGFARGGDYNSRLLLLLDGLRMNSNLYGEADYGRGSVIDVAIIDRVEIIRGPSSSIYGTSAFFGVINVITKKGRDLDGAEFEAGIGSRRAGDVRASIGRRLDTGLEYLLSASGFGTRGAPSLYYPEFDAAATRFGKVNDGDGESARRISGRLRYGDLSLSAGYVERDKNVPTAAYGTVFGDTRFRTHDERTFAELRYDTLLGASTRLRISGSLHSMLYGAAYPTNLPPVVINRDRAVGRWGILDAQLTTPLGSAHMLTGGVDMQRNARIEQTNADNVQRLSDVRSDNRYGAYVQDEWRITPSVILNLGLRHDSNSTYGGSTNPRGALVLKPRDGTTVKVLAGRAFRAPNAYELYYADGLLYAANPLLRPERINNRELVLEQSVARGFSITGNFYRNKVDNFIQQVTDAGTGFLVYQNLGGLDTRGWEMEGHWRTEGGMDLRAAYSRQSSQDAITGARVAGSPAWTGKLNFSMPIAGERTTLAASARFISARPTLAGNTIAQATMVDAFVRFGPAAWRNVGFAAGVSNLFNRKTADPGGAEHTQDVIPQDGRLWRLQMEIGF